MQRVAKWRSANSLRSCLRADFSLRGMHETRNLPRGRVRNRRTSSWCCDMCVMRDGGTQLIVGASLTGKGCAIGRKAARPAYLWHLIVVNNVGAFKKYTTRRGAPQTRAITCKTEHRRSKFDCDWCHEIWLSLARGPWAGNNCLFKHKILIRVYHTRSW